MSQNVVFYENSKPDSVLNHATYVIVKQIITFIMKQYCLF